MRVMVLVKATEDSEKGTLPTPELLEAMGKYNEELRNAGITVELGDETFRLKKSFETAEKLGITHVLIVGENEIKADAFALKDLNSGEQDTVARREIAHRFAR